MRSTSGLTLADGMDLAGVGYDELWSRYIGIGGSGTVADLRRRIRGDDEIDPHEHDVIAQAINEHFLERDEDHPVAYWRPAIEEPDIDPAP